MSNLRRILIIADILIDLSIKFFAIYYFFFKGEHFAGAIMFGASALWSISTLVAAISQKALKIINPNKK